MKKYFLLLLLAIGFLASCEPETADAQTYEYASDKDEEPDK